MNYNDYQAINRCRRHQLRPYQQDIVNWAESRPPVKRRGLSETTKCWLATIAIMAVATAFIVFMAAYGPQGGGR